jgi:hypothetical protein
MAARRRYEKRGDTPMRTITAAGLAAAVIGFAAAAPTPSSATEYPWCARYSGRDGGSTNCGFVSFAQCRATVHGVGGTCDRNPMFFAYVEPAPRVRYRVVHPYYYYD